MEQWAQWGIPYHAICIKQEYYIALYNSCLAILCIDQFHHHNRFNMFFSMQARHSQNATPPDHTTLCIFPS